MLNHNTSRIEKNCRALIKSFKKQISWEWDGRFEAVLAQFSVDDKEVVQKIIERHMSNIWVDENKSDAPEKIAPIIEYFGGLEPGQKLFTSALDERDIILCAWWPWGNGRNISIRLSIFAFSLSDEENEELAQKFRTWFDL